MFRKIACCIIFFISFLFLSAQQKQDNYNQAWLKIDSLVNKKGLTQSALNEVNKIYTHAKKENNDAQLIKALLYRMMLQEQRVEDAEAKNIRELEKEIPVAREPSRSIIQSILAESYWNYLRQNRWKFYNRTLTINFKRDDIATWTIDDFHQTISSLFLSSIRQEQLLKQTNLQQFDPIIIKGNSRYLRPTLYDLLTHRALDYFKNDERDITRPAYAFEIDNSVAFSDSKVFAGYHFVSKDTQSLYLKALRIYQQLVTFHLADTKPDALIDVDVERIQFVNAHTAMANKDELYKKALESLVERYREQPPAAQASYLLAENYASKARQYDPLKDTSNRFAFITAKAICEKIIQQKENSEGKTNCLNLLHEIMQKEVSTRAEKVNVPGQPFRMLVSYRNFLEIHFRLIILDKQTREKLGTASWEDSYWKKLLQLPVKKTFSQSLPDTKDFQKHSTEIKVDGLAVGEYALVASAAGDFSLTKNRLAVQLFYVSNISYINNFNDYFVLNRETGQPLGETKVQVWIQEYDYKAQRYAKRKSELLTTDNHGFFQIKDNKLRNNSVRLELWNPNDYLFIDEEVYSHSRPEVSEQPVKEFKNTFLFTDRSIYRPGQVVFFKGIVTSRNSNIRETAVATNIAGKVFLFDVNGQRIDSVQVVTNEFGSYSGKFTFPVNVLNGEFRIEDNISNNGIRISVEEYKRPKFYVEINKPAGTYKLADSIKVKGSAKAYGGNNIDGAKVKYRVIRRTRFPMWYYGYEYKIWRPYPVEEVEITNGETITDSKGEFTINFTALPDKKILKKDQPVFHYEVLADVTDINGETRTGNTTVAVGFQALQVTIDIPAKLKSDSLKNLKLFTKNLNEIFEKATVTVKIIRLQPPGRIFRKRLWGQPDQFVMTREEYYQFFPYDIYDNEDNPGNWSSIEKVFEKTDTSSADGEFPITNLKLDGWFALEAVSTDKYGEEVKDTRYIQIYDHSLIESPVEFGSIETIKQSLEPDDKAMYQLSTNLDNVFVIHDIERIDQKQNRTFVSLNKESRPFEFAVTDNDRGGIHLAMAFVKHNRIYSDNLDLDVPFSNKELNISTETFRDKTLPGSKEKWKVKISGNKGNKIAAEMLTGMYDASLDEFKPHQWNIPAIWQRGLSPGYWNGRPSFVAIESMEKSSEESEGQYFEKIYDQLISPQEAIYTSRNSKLLQGRVSGISVNKQKGEEVEDVALVDLKKDAKDSKPLTDTVSTDKQTPSESQQTLLQLRKNFNETAFFFPDLKTDSNGNIEFSFTMPEALTQWKWMTLAHTKDLSFGFSERSVITQKPLMVQPNAPRFLREGDRMDFSGKIVNMTSKELTGQVQLQLLDPANNQSVDGWFRNMFPNQYFTVPPGESVALSFTIEVPFQYDRPVIYSLVANAGDVSDGEQNTLPVLTNRMLITESMPLPVRGNMTKQFRFEKLLQSGNSETLTHHSMAVEFTSNPAWYAVQALPFLADYPYECAEQIFNRYYANALASKIADASPQIKQIVDRWSSAAGGSAFLSNLQKNPELKSVLLEETPWVMDAKNEEQQKRNIALLFDMQKMNTELESSLRKLSDMQSPAGGFVWFKGGPDDRFITQYIVTGIGHLKRVGAIPAATNNKVQAILKMAIQYLDKKLQEDFANLTRNKVDLNKNNLGYAQIQYLYMRSFFSEYGVPGDVFNAYNYYRKQSQRFWLQQGRYMQGMIALSLHRTGDLQTAKNILASLKESATVTEEMGMYWKDVNSGYYWYQAPVETQSLLIETFSEISNDHKSVDDLKTWLLKNKQVNHWRTTKATSDACYALLLEGTDWLSETPEISVKLGDVNIQSTNESLAGGTGYFKKTIEGKMVQPSMGVIQVFVSTAKSTIPNTRPSWGSVYWQYFENLDKITPAATPLKLTKKLFVEKNTSRGPVLQPVKNGEALKTGDKVKVRIELTVDRAMEYVHMKDMRASCMEPVNVISQYKWQAGLGYYETTKDASTSFFFNWLPKGTYVFEYPLFVTHTGTFSNGVTNIQCMYAPEFSSHSEGIKVVVE